MKLELSRLHFPVMTLGPGRRVGVWMQGCSIRCEGCVSVDTWARGRGVSSVDRVLEVIRPWLEEADGITISGGEPFDQPDALRSLLIAIRAETVADILIFSGYPIEHLQHQLITMNGLIDALVSDPYDIRAPQTLALRGSDNQRLHCLTPLGFRRFCDFEWAARSDDAALDVMFDEDGSVWMAGIPRRGDMDRLRQVLATQGHAIVTSQAISLADREDRDE